MDKILDLQGLEEPGYVVKEGVGRLVDFRVYEMGKYREKAAKYVVFAICKGNPVSASRLGEALRLVHGMKKHISINSVGPVTQTSDLFYVDKKRT